MTASGCPPDSVLQALATGEAAVPDQVRAHVGDCPRCQAALQPTRGSQTDASHPGSSVAGAALAAKLAAPDEPTLDVGVPLSVDPVQSGERLNRYVVLHAIGRGGMAAVYKAFDPELDRTVALKVMFPGGAGTQGVESRGRFVREAQAMARVSHANVIEVYDAGTVGDKAFITMKLVEGTNLREWGKTRPSWRDALDKYLAAGRGLAAAHAVGLVHRDFKPSNVLLAKDGAVYVTDFGLARLATDRPGPVQRPSVAPASAGALSTDFTKKGIVSGTEGFIAPELYAGGAANEQSDQFSFAVALFTALFGEFPYLRRLKDPDAPKDAPAVRLEPIPEPAGDVPAWVRRIVRRGLAVDPAARWPSMQAMLDALADDPRVKQRRWAAIAAGLVLAVAVPALLSRQASARQELCAGADRNLAGVWDAPRRAAGQEAFQRSQLTFAGNAWSTVAGALDDYARSWVQMRTEACTATRIRGEQSDEVLSVRMLCLDRRLAELKALVAQLGQADPKVVEKAPLAAASLVPVEVCANVASLRDVLRMPADPALKPRLEELTRLLAEVKALRDSGRFTEGLALAQRAVAAADALQYSPLQGEAHLALGRLKSELGETKVAEAELLTALAHAERGRDDRTRAAALTQMVWVLGGEQERYAAATSWEQVANGVLERLGGDTEIQLALLNIHGGLLFGQSKMDELIVHQKHQVELQERLIGAANPLTLNALINYGSALAGHGDYVEAIAVYRRASQALEKTMGRRYFRFARAQNNLAELLVQQGQAAQALPIAEEAAATLTAARGATHRETIGTQQTVASALLGSGEPARALQFVDEHWEAWRSSQADAPGFAEAIDLRAKVLRALKRHGEATALLDDAVARHRQRPAMDPIITLLLTARGDCELELGRPVQALPLLEEAVALGIKLHTRPIWLAHAKFALARALKATGADAGRAAALGREAQAAFAHAGMRRAEEVAAWAASGG